MPAPVDWISELERALGSSIRETRPIAGGDIARSYRAELSSGSAIFVKQYPPKSGASPADPRTNRADPDTAPERAVGVAAAEARGLEWLREARALHVARPLAWGDDWLALEWIERGPPAADYDRVLGRGLAELHAAAPDGFGFEARNWIGSLPQANTPCEDWAAFYGEQRILPLMRRARDAGMLEGSVTTGLERIVARLPELVGPPEPPARLHGDLWSGNVMPDEEGLPCLIDPAVYGGHREIDLAMMRLFGGFSEAVFRAYEGVTPLAVDVENRVPLYQLYPLLVHVCLFGEGYVDSLARAAAACL